MGYLKLENDMNYMIGSQRARSRLFNALGDVRDFPTAMAKILLSHNVDPDNNDGINEGMAG